MYLLLLLSGLEIVKDEAILNCKQTVAILISLSRFTVAVTMFRGIKRRLFGNHVFAVCSSFWITLFPKMPPKKRPPQPQPDGQSIKRFFIGTSSSSITEDNQDDPASDRVQGESGTVARAATVQTSTSGKTF